MTRRRTYWHLEGAGRMPSAYDVCTTRLLYHPTVGYSVDTPVAAWQRRNVPGLLRCADWDRYRDPRETTYSEYVARRERREIFVDGLLDAAESTDARLAPGWVAVLEQVLAPLRYPIHVLQMVAAYAGSLAPSGRLVVAWLFQAADELRRVQRLAYRMRQLQETFVDFGASARRTWEEDEMWQPWRRVLEKLLVVRRFDETIAALDLAVKPAFEEMFLVRFAAAALAAGDDTLHKLLLSLREDGVWHAERSAALVDMLTGEDPANGEALEELARPWRRETGAANAAIAPLLGGAAC